MQSLLPLKQLNLSRWRWLFELTIFCHSSRRTYADASWTMTKDAKHSAPPAAGEIGDTSLRGAHKDTKHWKFECWREHHEAAQFFRLLVVTRLVAAMPWPATVGHLSVPKPSSDTLKVCRSPTLASVLLPMTRHDQAYGLFALWITLRLCGDSYWMTRDSLCRGGMSGSPP